MSIRHYLPLVHEAADTLIGSAHPVGLLSIESEHDVVDAFVMLYNDDINPEEGIDAITSHEVIHDRPSIRTAKFTTEPGAVFFVTFFRIID